MMWRTMSFGGDAWSREFTFYVDAGRFFEAPCPCGSVSLSVAHDVLDFAGCPMPKASAPKAPWVLVWSRRRRWSFRKLGRGSELKADDVDDALDWGSWTSEELDAEVSAVFAEGFGLLVKAISGR